MSPSKKELKYAIEILTKSPDLRSQPDLDFLSMFLLFLEDFRKYITKLNIVLKYQLCRKLTIETYQKDEVIFNKGDPSDKYYIILKGSVSAINMNSEGTEIIIGIIGPGKQFGERGIIKNLPRNLKIAAAEKSLLLALTDLDFRNILGDYVKQFLEHKVNFIITYVPYVGKYSAAHKERAAYAMNMGYYKRGDKIVQEGGICEFLFFVYEGECVICFKDGNKEQQISKLTTGMCFGEECVLFGKTVMWTVVTFSEYSTVLTIRRNDLITSFPSESVDALKESFKLKMKGREFLMHTRNNSVQMDDSSVLQRKLSDSGIKLFPLATNYARKRLFEIATRDNSTTKSRQNIRDGQRFHKELETLRYFSNSRPVHSGRVLMTPDIKDLRWIKRKDSERLPSKRDFRTRSQVRSLLY